MQKVIVYRNPLEAAFWEDPAGFLLFFGMILAAIVAGLLVAFATGYILTRICRSFRAKKTPTLSGYPGRTPKWINYTAFVVGLVGAYFAFKALERSFL